MYCLFEYFQLKGFFNHVFYCECVLLYVCELYLPYTVPSVIILSLSIEYYVHSVFRYFEKNSCMVYLTGNCIPHLTWWWWRVCERVVVSVYTCNPLRHALPWNSVLHQLVYCFLKIVAKSLCVIYLSPLLIILDGMIRRCDTGLTSQLLK